jgi:uncharacterized membrane protein
MSETIKPLAEAAALFIEALGIALIVGFALYVLVFAGFELLRRSDVGEIFRKTRQRLGRGILFGLEFLVAADIIHTVAVELTFSTVGVLAIVVLIRTFLSFTLDVELTGYWPWQEKSRKEQHL